MAIQSAMSDAALRLVGYRPQVFFGSPNQTELELADLINEVANDVCKYQDWQALARIGTITGDGVTGDFPLPADYDRMLITSAMQDLPSWAWGYFQYDSIDQFLFDEARGWPGFPGGWIIYGNRLRFSPLPSVGQTGTFPYITANYATSQGGTAKPAFTEDADTFALPERLLTLGLVWRWRENKKLDASGDQEAFIKALDEYASKDRGPSVFRRRSRRVMPGIGPAWPWALGPSTYIDH